MKIDNAEDRAKAFPEFKIPSRKVRASFKVGDHVKLIFISKDGEDGERMWVRVTANLMTGRYEGTLSNKPAFLPLTFGESISFGPEHIIDFKRLDS